MNINIIGLPAIVSKCYRIVIDKSLRHNYAISENDSVLMLAHKDFLQIYARSAKIINAELKDISIGRFNLPVDWARRNNVHEGDFVYLVGTTDSLLIYPAMASEETE